MMRSPTIASLFAALLLLVALPSSLSFAIIQGSSSSSSSSSKTVGQQRTHNWQLQQQANSNTDGASPPILCDLQTLLRMAELVPSGGSAKTVIQAGKCQLNGEIETRRAKKLFPGDVVTLAGKVVDVSKEVEKRGYVFKVKAKKVKPLPRVDADGTLEFGGRFRSEEWRKERKEKKAARKVQNTAEE